MNSDMDLDARAKKLVEENPMSILCPRKCMQHNPIFWRLHLDRCVKINDEQRGKQPMSSYDCRLCGNGPALMRDRIAKFGLDNAANELYMLPVCRPCNYKRFIVYRAVMHMFCGTKYHSCNDSKTKKNANKNNTESVGLFSARDRPANAYIQQQAVVFEWTDEKMEQCRLWFCHRNCVLTRKRASATKKKKTVNSKKPRPSEDLTDHLLSSSSSSLPPPPKKSKTIEPVTDNIAITVFRNMTAANNSVPTTPTDEHNMVQWLLELDDLPVDANSCSNDFAERQQQEEEFQAILSQEHYRNAGIAWQYHASPQLPSDLYREILTLAESMMLLSQTV